MQDALLTTTGAVGGQIAHQAVILDLELQVMVPKETSRRNRLDWNEVRGGTNPINL